jgi:hypothetical protein
MNLKKIFEVVTNGDIPDDTKERMIYDIISKDENALLTIIHILHAERKRKKELIINMNAELSRAHVTIKEPRLNKDHFVYNEIVKFYDKNNDQIGHCFANCDTKLAAEPKKERKKRITI